MLKQTDQSPSGQSSSDQSGSSPRHLLRPKRGTITSVACEPCRRRKSKCDGVRPTCSACGGRPSEDCYYELDADQRRTAHLRESIESLQGELASLKHTQTLLRTIQTADEDEAYRVFRQLRGLADLTAEAEAIQRKRQAARDNSGLTYNGAADAGFSPSEPPSSEQIAVWQTQAHLLQELTNTFAISSESEAIQLARLLQARQEVQSVLEVSRAGMLRSPASIPSMLNGTLSPGSDTHRTSVPSLPTRRSNEITSPLSQETSMDMDPPFPRPRESNRPSDVE
ncbi:MAG: hypothetical protein M4579_004275 [Chaenotheca gracillima]|nr:MAG: hypothetical protein M4579_004275 [Chaenotheca gracillima]